MSDSKHAVFKDGVKESNTAVLVLEDLRLVVSSKEVWEAFRGKATRVACIRCFDTGGQCTRNYPAGCKGNF